MILIESAFFVPSFAVAVIVTAPTFSPVTSPAAFTVAIFASDVVHVTSCCASDGAASAVSSSVFSAARSIAAAARSSPSTRIVTPVAFGNTVTAHSAVSSLPSVVVAVIVVVFASVTAAAVTKPADVTVATVGSALAHTSVFFVVFAGSNTGVKVSFPPAISVFSAGSAMALASTTTFTDMVAYFLLPSFAVAVIVAEPAPTAVTTPVSAFTVAIFALDVVHLSALLLALDGVMATTGS